MSSRTLLCLIAASLCTPVLADTVWMKNGDRLSGKIKVFDGGKLLLETPYGGSIALGHPFGATGARMVIGMARELQRRQADKALLALCAAGGMGTALLMERI